MQNSLPGHGESVPSPGISDIRTILLGPPQLEPQSTPEPGNGAGMKLRILAKTKARKYTLKRIARKA